MILGCDRRVVKIRAWWFDLYCFRIEHSFSDKHARWKGKVESTLMLKPIAVMVCSLQMWPIYEGLTTVLLMCCLAGAQNVEPNVEIAEENSFHPDQGISSVNDFSMLTENKSIAEDASVGRPVFDRYGYVLYCPCMGSYTHFLSLFDRCCCTRLFILKIYVNRNNR